MPSPNERPQSIQEIYDTFNGMLEENDTVDSISSGNPIACIESNDDFWEQQKSDEIDIIREVDNNSQHSSQQLTTEQMLNLVLIAEVSKEDQDNVFRRYPDMLNGLLRELSRPS